MNQFLIDNQLYLEFLEIADQDVPFKNDSINKQELCKIVESQFRKLARKYHPDYGGTNEQFKFLLDCKTKLIEEDKRNNSFSLNLNNQTKETFDTKSLASQLGNQLFDLISTWSEELKIKPIYRPTKSEDEYEWIFAILDSNYELCLNVQNMNEDLAEISHELYKDTSLSILVCLFVPSKQMTVTNVAYDNSVIYKFDDKIFIESSCSDEITKYFCSCENIQKDLSNFLSGNFKSRENVLLKTKKTEEVLEKDKKVIEFLQNLKIFDTQFDESAADFLDKL